MNLLRWAGAIALALLATPAASQSLAPQCRNAAGAYIPCVPVMQVDKTGVAIDAANPLPTGGVREAFQLASANTVVASVTVYGGDYILA